MGEADLPGSDDADAITHTQIHAAGMRHADTRIRGTQLLDCGDGLLDGIEAIDIPTMKWMIDAIQ